LTIERHKSLENFFNNPVSPKNVKAIEKMIRAILDSDNEVKHFIESEKQKTFKKYANLQNNNKANQTYKNVAALNFR